MGEFNEYVFCPHCGGITAPGTCVNCGMPTNGQAQSPNITQNEIAEQATTKSEPAYNKYQPQGQSVTQGYEQYQPQGQPVAHRYEQYQPKATSEITGNVQNQAPVQTQTPGYNPYQQPMGTTNYGYGYGQPNGHGMGQNYSQTSSMGNQYQQPNVTYNEAPKKKSRWWIWLLVIGFVLFFGVILVAIAILVSILFFGANNTTATGLTGQTQIPTTPQVITQDSSDEYEDTGIIVNGRELGRLDFSDFDWDSYADYAMVYSDTDDGSKDFFLNKDYESSFGSNHDNHTLSEFTGQYYEPFVDCIDTSYDYGLSRHFISYSDVTNNIIVNADIAYIQLEGDTVPNEDELNRQILEMTANDFWGYLDGQTSLSYTPSEVNFMVDSFIPYNDGEKMSILLDVNVYYDGYQEEHYIYGINIDMENGEIMDNASILEIDEDFGAMFRERNNAQNGADVVGVVNSTDEELADLLASSDTNIIFYSPYGMEIGFNYMADGYSWGWVTITLSDYEDYLN